MEKKKGGEGKNRKKARGIEYRPVQRKLKGKGCTPPRKEGRRGSDRNIDKPGV